LTTLVLQAATVDLARGAVTRTDGEARSLTDTERRLLAYLASRPHRDVPRDELLREVWGHAGVAVTRAVDDAMKRLRAKVEARAGAPFHLLTAQGVGYRFEPLPETIAETPAPSPAPAGRAPLVLGDRIVDLDRRTVTGPDGIEPLSTLEAGVIACLADAKGRPVSSQELLAKVWGHVRTERRGAVEKLVSRLRPRLGDDGDAPRFLHTVRGGGYRLDLPRAVAPAAPLAPGLFGREADLARVRALLEAGTSVITITGTGGIGKTRLARELLGGEGVFCALATARTESDVREAVTGALGLPAGSPDARVTMALHRVTGPVVLDDCERAVTPVRTLVARWSAAAPATFVVTSREPLGLASEHLVELGPLSPSAARDLFLARAAAQDAAAPFAASPDLPRILAALDGLPLAIELAASRTRVLDPESLLARLADRFAVLKSPDDTDRGALWRAIARSWEAASAAERAALAQCTVFPASFTLAAAESVIVTGGPPVVEVLESLRRRSLLHVERPVGGLSVLRFTLMQAIRDFCTPDRPDPDVERRFLASCAARAEALSQRWFGPDSAAVTVEFDLELPALRAAIAAGLHRDPDVAVRITDALTDAYRGAPFLLDLLPAVLPHARGDAGARLRANLVDSEVDQGNLDAALRLLAEAPPAETPTQRAWYALAQAAFDMTVGRKEAAEAGLLATMPEIGTIAPVPRTLFTTLLSTIASDRGDAAQAEHWARRSLAVARQAGDGPKEGEIRVGLARFCLQRGAVAEAKAHYEAGIATWPVGKDVTAEVPAWIALEEGRLADATLGYRSAIRWYERTTERGYSGKLHVELGLAHHLTGELEAAEEAYRTGLELTPVGSRRVRPWATGHLALLLAQRDRVDPGLWPPDLDGDARWAAFRRLTDATIAFVSTGEGAEELLGALAAARSREHGLPPVKTSWNVRHQVTLAEQILAARGLLEISRARSRPNR
jgi:DNA-binding response OmpR family regulator